MATFSSTNSRVGTALVDGGLGDVDRVLVGAGQEPRVVAEHPVPARDRVGADDLVQRVHAGFEFAYAMAVVVIPGTSSWAQDRVRGWAGEPPGRRAGRASPVP
jgi:hypothetical protein